jgi:hypothetical protein
MQFQPPYQNGHLADDEAQLIATLVQSNAQVSIGEIPANPDPEAVFAQLDLCLRVHRKTEAVTWRLRPLIGKFLSIAKNHPEVYEKHGFATYTDFINLYVCGQMGLSRSALYEARMISERTPSVTPDQYQELGPTKALALARFSRSSDPSFGQFLEEARSRSATSFIKFAEERGLLEKGETKAVVIVIQANDTIAKMWAEFVGLPEVHSHVGSANGGEILKALIQEGYFWTVPERGV